MEPKKKNKTDNVSVKKSTPDEEGVEDLQGIEEKFYNSLNHEVRRKIIRMIGSQGEGSFTNFKKVLKVSTGTLYHHLDVLKELITQNSKRKYILTNLGKHAYNFLSKNYDTIESDNIEEQKFISASLKKFISLIPNEILHKVNDLTNPIKVLISVGILSLFFILIFIGNINSSFIFFVPYNTSNTELEVIEKIALGLKFIVFTYIVVIISELLCRYLFNKTENTKNFVLIFPIALIPMLPYLFIYDMLFLFAPTLVNTIFNKFIMIIFQIWTIWLITYIIITFKYLKLERALLITFVIHYGTFTVLLFFNT